MERDRGGRERERERVEKKTQREREGEREREREIQRQAVMGKEGMCPVVVLEQGCDSTSLLCDDNLF